MNPREEEAAMAEFEREAKGVVGADEVVAMPAPTDVFFGDEGLTLRDWAANRQAEAAAQDASRGRTLSGKALLLGDGAGDKH